MKLQINLSHQPFYNRRLFWLGIFILISATGLFGAWTLKRIRESTDDIERLQVKIREQNLQLKVLKSEPAESVPALGDAQIKQIQAAAALIKQRGFSWTAMLEEFERALPITVRISSITLKSDRYDEEMLGSGSLLLSVKILAKSPEDVTKMIAEMDKRGIFRIEPKSQLIANQFGDIGFDLDVSYLQPQRQARSETKRSAAKAAKKERAGSDNQFAKGGESD